jgi:hypothetical protein
VKEIIRQHGTPASVISDRGPQFASETISYLYQRLGIKPILSTAYHPQTDGQSERTNQTLEQYLRLFTNHRQTNWLELLPIAEFAYNNATHSSTGVSPFFANLGRNPTMMVQEGSNQKFPSIDERIALIAETQEDLKSALLLAQERMKKFYDRNAGKLPTFNVGDKMYLEMENLKSDRPSKKLDHRRVGPYKIIRQVGSHAYQLDLPPTMKIHPVFHVSLLTPYVVDTIPGRIHEEPPPVIIDDEEEWELEEILDSKWTRNKLWYKVRWKGYDEGQDPWQPAEFITHADDLVKEFHKKFPEAASPTVRPAPRRTRRSRT